MVDDVIERFKQLKKEMETLNTTINTTVIIDVDKIKQEIEDKLKRELAGRSSYGIGV